MKSLAWNDAVIVHAFHQKYTFRVRSVEPWVAPENMQALRHEDLSWLTLITCQGYDAKTNTYGWRTIVRAVLVGVEAED